MCKKIQTKKQSVSFSNPPRLDTIQPVTTLEVLADLPGVGDGLYFAAQFRTKMQTEKVCA